MSKVRINHLLVSIVEIIRNNSSRIVIDKAIRWWIENVREYRSSIEELVKDRIIIVLSKIRIILLLWISSSNSSNFNHLFKRYSAKVNIIIVNLVITKAI